MKKKRNVVNVAPIATAIILALPLMAHAELILNNAGTVNVVNGVPVVNINKANENGISHNIYGKLDAGKEGLIFNNSVGGANTQLVGAVSGNSNLTSGSASIILNEVTSSRSNLAGVLEVAGDKAHLIIANPSGITCSGCGFVNTDKITLTTGKPDMQNGVLRGFSVTGGDVRVESAMVADSPTAILARSAVVNGTVSVSGDLDVVLGSNYVNYDNEVISIQKTGSLFKGNSLDVARLGGMYADKISLVSTEAGFGVNNSGVIAAGSGGLQLDIDGRLRNTSAAIRSTGDISLKLAGELNNVGGTLATEKSIYIDTKKNTLNNSGAGTIASGANIAISSGNLDNSNGKMAATNLLAINTNGSTLRNRGKGSSVGLTAGVVALESGTMDNSDGQINAGYVGIKSANFSNRSGTIDALQDIELVSTGNSVDNNAGRLRTVNGAIKISAARATLNNNNTRTADAGSNDSLGILAGEGGITISTNSLENNGVIASTGDVGIKSTSNINNQRGDISSAKTTSIETKNLSNYASLIAATSDLNLSVTGKLDNYVGALRSEEGTLSIKGGLIDSYGGMMLGKDINIEATGSVNANAALMVATNDIVINAGGDISSSDGLSFGNPYGSYFGMANQKGGIIGKGSVSLTGRNVYNDRGRIIAEGISDSGKGLVKIVTAGNLSNNSGVITGKTGVDIDVNGLYNDYGKIYSSGNVNINLNSLSNKSSGSNANNDLTGFISSDSDLSLTARNSFENKGYITGTNKVTVTTTKGSVSNHKVISSANEVNVNSEWDVFNDGDLVSGKTLNVKAANGIDNRSNILSSGALNIDTKSIFNFFGTIGGAQGLYTDASITNWFGTIAGKVD